MAEKDTKKNNDKKIRNDNKGSFSLLSYLQSSTYWTIGI